MIAVDTIAPKVHVRRDAMPIVPSARRCTTTSTSRVHDFQKVAVRAKYQGNRDDLVR